MRGDKARRWVVRIALVNGWSVVVAGLLCALAGLACLSWLGLLLGAVGLASGAMELTGRRRLLDGRPARAWLAGSQLLLLGAILLYAGSRLLWTDPQALVAQLPPEIRQALEPLAPEEDLAELVRWGVQLVYGCVAGVTVLYQGGLCLLYLIGTRRPAPEAADPAATGAPR